MNVNPKKLQTPDGMTVWVLPHDEFLVEQAGKYIREYKGPLEVVADLGAHVGIVTMAAAHRGAKVYAFEPAAINVEMLRRNVVENNLANVTIIPLAVTNHSGDFLPLLRSSDLLTSGQHSLQFNPEKFDVEGHVYTLSLFQLLSTIFSLEGRLDYLKCDIEGGEYSFIDDDPKLHALIGRVGFIEMSIHPLGDQNYFGGPRGNYVTKMEEWLEAHAPGRWMIPWEKPEDRKMLIELGEGK